MTIIVGAGLSGLIAASMLRGKVTDVIEQSPDVPNNHHALLRFRSSVVGDAVGIPFRKVRVMKAIQPWRNPVADMLSYSMKSTGKVELRSIVSAQGLVEERYIAPPDLVKRLAVQSMAKMTFDAKMKKSDLGKQPFISTIPMQTLMTLLGWEDIPEFPTQSGFVISCDLPENINVCATVYLPDPDQLPYRVSITDRKLIIEISESERTRGIESDQSAALSAISRNFLRSQAISESLYALGLLSGAKGLGDFVRTYHKIHRMKFAKIAPIDEAVRRRFIMWASEKHGVYSLGRFATWRPGLLLDDIINDVRVIEHLIQTGDTYRHKLKG